MLPSKAPYITNTYSFANSLDISVYPLSHIYDFATANYNGILVYLIRNNVQTQLNGKLPLSGGTVTGNLKVNGWFWVEGNTIYFSDSGDSITFDPATSIYYFNANIW
jgi:hypothetical protein